MKKNITINLFGSLYAIDDDACQLLEQYLNNMRSYFSKREGGDEIADDIEHRVAELFSELKEQGIEAISIENVQEIIQRIGNPEQMDDDANAETNDENTSDNNDTTPPPAPDCDEKQRKSRWSAHKLYRDPQDQMLGGVMSGLCHYFGGSDPLPWRILMVLLALISFSTIGIIYLVAWALIPAANTAEERLQMQGKPVNPQTLNDELMKGAQRAGQYVQSSNFKNGARSLGRTFLNIIVFCFKLLLLLIIGSLLLGLIIGASLFIAACFEHADGDNLASYLQQSSVLFWYAILAFLSGFICLCILFYGSLRMLLKSPKSKPLSTATIITLVVISLLTAISATTFGILSTLKVKQIQRELRIKNNTVNGIFIDNDSRNKMAIDNWKLIQANNCNRDGNFYSYTDDFDESNDRVIYIFDKDNENLPMTINIERTENLPAGNYHIECITQIDGPGLYLYYKDAVASLISLNNKGQGNFANMPYTQAMNTKAFPDTLTEPWWLYHQREEVSEWNYQCTSTFNHEGGPITYSIRGTQGAGADEVKIMQVKIVKD